MNICMYQHKIFVVVSDIDSALYDGIDCIALKARDIVRVLYQSLSNFSFIRTFKNKEFVEGWIPTSRLVVPQLTTNSDVIMSIKVHYPFSQLDRFPENIGDLGEEQGKDFIRTSRSLKRDIKAGGIATR
ncbi:hypothetical protein LOD99_5503 [Oopsacas minuta]|uniref:Uncharacterized protein n=1 Tax=Oopsacas minuta TaxID=111878 RepID=A0AAV7JQA3_9METZ|nr:hypothetical protein LOD99_5503 [Oopsacas minuta]